MNDDLFEILNNLYEKRGQFPEDFSSGNLFMVNRFLSMNRDTFPAAVDANVMGGLRGLPQAFVLKFLWYAVPRYMRAPRVKYIKKSDTEREKVHSGYNRVVSEIAGYWHCSIRHAEQVFKILEAYGEDPYMIFGIKKAG